MKTIAIEGTMTDQQREKYEAEGRAVGLRLYWSLDSDAQAVIAFGMTPLELLEMFSKNVREKIAKDAADHYGAKDYDLKTWALAVKKEVINAYEHGFTLGLFEAATKAGKMIV